MEYIVIDEDKIKKYNITYDKEKLTRLRYEMINCCSVIRHRIIVSDYELFDTDTKEYRNIRKKSIGERDYETETRTIYEYQTDEYIYPKIVFYISKLFENDRNSITNILNYDSDDEKTIDKEIEVLNNDINNMDNTNIDLKIKKLEELKCLYNDKKINENQKSVKLYIEEVKSAINFELIAEIDLEYYNKLNNILNIDYNFDKPIKLIRKK